jgi:hypothetical protein
VDACQLEQPLSDVQIDTTFDFRTEIGPGRDPDACSPTLRLCPVSATVRQVEVFH